MICLMENTQKTGYELSIEGANRAAKSANNAFPNWTDRALYLIVKFARNNKQFTIEDVRIANPEFEEPPEPRAWGQVARQAKDRKFIEKIGIVSAKSKTVHNMNINLWKSKIFKE